MSAVEPFPFATVDELRQRWPAMPDRDQAYLEAQLEDASQFIIDIVPAAAKAAESSRRRVCCQVVRRALEAETQNLAGLESVQTSAGPFQDTYKPLNPHGDFYLTAQEKKALGGVSQKAGAVDMLGARK